MNKSDRATVALVVVSFIGLSLAVPANAQDTSRETERIVLEEIVVTAAYREQGLQDVPVSISAVTGQTLVETGLQKAEDIQFLVPNLTVNETGISTNVFVRGVGSGINQAFEQSVATFIDGVYSGRAQQFRSPFLDLERVEVLRGPQSILFGKNAVAGALNITTARPTDELVGGILASHEFEDEETIIEGYLSGPLSDTVRGRIAARSRDLGGYIENATLGAAEPNREDWTVRGTLEFDLGDNVMATFKAEIGEFDVNGRHIEIINEQPSLAPAPLGGLLYSQILAGAFGADPSVLNVERDDVRSANGDFSFNDSEVFALTLDWDIGENQLKSITAFSNFEYEEFCDCDFTGANVFGAALQENYEQFSQELRFSSPIRDTWDYIVGLYYQTSEHDFSDQITVESGSILVPAINLRSPGAGDLVASTEASRLAGVDNDVVSAFAQFNWHATDSLTLQFGGRFTRDERDGFRELTVQSLGGGTLPAPQTTAPFVYANLFGITSTNLVAFAQSGVPQLVVPAEAFLFYGFADAPANTIPCTAASDPADCSSGLGVLPVENSRETDKFSPEVKLIWDATDDAMLFLTWSEGFKSGSFDFRANNQNFYPDMLTSFEFDDEEVSNIELGGKFTLAEGALELNATAFFEDFKDLQISIFDGILGFNVGNAAEAEITGLEVDWRWAASESLYITGGLAFTDFEFTDFENGQCYFGQVPNVDINGDGTPELCSYTGKSNQLVSDFQANVSFRYDRDIGRGLELRTLLDVFHTGEYESSATFDPGLVQDAYTKLNARLAIASVDGGWEVALLGRNLTDERVLQFGGDTPLAGSNFGAKSNYAFFSRGRTLTLQASLNF